jgi:hypothetical protein
MVFHCPRLAGMASMVAQHSVARMVNTILARGIIFRFDLLGKDTTIFRII